MKVFISWSKLKSKELAIKTKELLESIDSEVKAFVSEIDINGGEDVQRIIIKRIMECEKLVLCFTKENKNAPWLLFEAGFARGIGKTVIPLLFDDDPNWHSWIDNPMNIAREISFSNNNFINVFAQSFDINPSAFNYAKIEEYRQSVIKIKNNFKKVDSSCEDFVEKLVHNEAFIVESPSYKDKTAYFLSGFESHHLYKTIIDSFLYTGKYLWIYGRKNMKLFTGGYDYFFEYLIEKTLNNSLGMQGIDFRCLFLDPNSPEVKTAHQDELLLELELNTTILRAKKKIGTNNQLKNCFRLYENKRDEIIIRMDNCIIYSLPVFDIYGRPQLLTNTGFEVFSVKSDKGKECLKKFENVWTNAREFD